MSTRQPVQQLLLIGALVSLSGVVAASAIVGHIWWQERPLAAAERQLNEGDPERASQILKEFLAEHPRHERALALKGRLLVALGRPSEAIDLFERVGAANRKELHAWAQALLHQQRWSGALPVLEHLLNQDPDDPDVLHEITACRTRLGEFRAALDSAEALARITGFEARGYLLLGTIHFEMGNEQLAVEAWKHVLEHDPEAENLQIPADEFFSQYGNSLLASGRPAEALGALERSLARTPSPQARALLGQACLQLGQPQRAAAAWTRALELDPANIVAREGLARAALERGDSRATIELLEPIASNPPVRSSTAYLMERAFALLGDRAAAAEWQKRKEELQQKERLDDVLNQLLVESPNSFWAQAVRAHRFAQTGNWTQAQAIASSLLDAAPDKPFIRELAAAIEKRSALPSLERIPVPRHF